MSKLIPRRKVQPPGLSPCSLLAFRDPQRYEASDYRVDITIYAGRKILMPLPRAMRLALLSSAKPVRRPSFVCKHHLSRIYHYLLDISHTVTGTRQGHHAK
jgi:hypothetical protein